LRGRLAPPIEVPNAEGPKELVELLEARHDAFALDAQGRVLAGGRVLAQLTRGASLTLPEVRLLEQAELGPGLRLRLQRRLLAFARDAVGRLLSPLRELGRSQKGALRAIAYQLEQGLGTALTRDLAPTLAVLSADDARELSASGVELGRISVALPALARRDALEQRAALLSAYQSGVALPATLGRPSYPMAGLSRPAWLALGYVLLGPWALRSDLAERAATTLAEERDLMRVLASLGVPRAERPRVVQALLRCVGSRVQSGLNE
jgi:ATP-dependent RNA helicase SUPV3L1/SUV3